MSEPYDVVQRSLSPKHSTLMPVTADPVLRQQLEAVMDAHTFPRWCKVSTEVMPLIWPLIEAWGAARVAETAEQIAQAIEAKRATHWALDIDHAAALARSVPGTTEGQSDG
jgi:hypothetical protein